MLRMFTHLLGKCGVPSLHRQHHHPTGHSGPWTQHVYGLGLKEAKDWVERYYDYYDSSQETELDRLRTQNTIHLIKRTRQTMMFLDKLGIKAAGDVSGLFHAKQFVTRFNN